MTLFPCFFEQTQDFATLRNVSYRTQLGSKEQMHIKKARAVKSRGLFDMHLF